MKAFTPAGRIALVVTLVYAGFLVMLARDLPHNVFTLLFSERGPFEQLSIVLWALLGAALLLKRALPLRLRLATAAVAFAFAAREADLHKAYTVMSITKIKFYWSPEVPLPQKLAGGLVLLTLIALLVFLTVQLYGYVVRRRGLLTPMEQQPCLLSSDIWVPRCVGFEHSVHDAE